MSYTFKITAILVSMICVIHSTAIESNSFRPVTGRSILTNEQHYQEEKSEGQVPGDYFEYLSEEDANTSMVAISSESADYHVDDYFFSSNSTLANSSQSTKESVLPKESESVEPNSERSLLDSIVYKLLVFAILLLYVAVVIGLKSYVDEVKGATKPKVNKPRKNVVRTKDDCQPTCKNECWKKAAV